MKEGDQSVDYITHSSAIQSGTRSGYLSMIDRLWYSVPASENPVESEVEDMKRKVLLISLLLISLVISPCLSWAWSGRVVGIADGDTITVLREKEQVRIRLYGIDTRERGQAFSKKARQFTSKTVYGKIFEVKVMATDRYGRRVAMIYADKTLFNEELVKAGLAWVYEFYCSEPICESWENFQLRARFDKRGLWGDLDRIPPWILGGKKGNRVLKKMLKRISFQCH